MPTIAVRVGAAARDGTVHVSSLPPGEYWLNTALLGISAGTECFHISGHPSRNAKNLVRYEWGDFAPATRQVAGKLIDSQPGQGDSPIWNSLHRVDVPISGATLKLQNPLTGAVFNTVSDRDRAFSFRFISNGIYVLHVEAGGAGAREYDSTDILIRLSDNATRNKLVLTRREAGGGSCGGAGLELQSTPTR